jgi:hypothetical protein
VFKFSFGGLGAEAGRFNGIMGMMFAPSGNLFVADAGNNRIQEFKPDGTFLRQFGTQGVANNQFKEPQAVAVAAGNTLVVADAWNHRVARWTHADQDPQSGVTKLEVKVDGAIVKTTAPGCASKNCAISGSWVLNANNFSSGIHKVDVVATDGVGLPTTKTLNIETHGDLVAPGVALSGSMTEQATVGTTRTTYKLKVSATDTGSAAEWKSGVVATAVKVDGNPVDSYNAACATEGCAVTREWTMQSSEYLGSHKVQVTATDGAGRTTTKELSITINKDVTPPKISTGTEAFFTQPQNWLVQKTYAYNTSATDENASGVANFQFKIDGVVLKQAYGTCAGGSCSKTLTGEINVLNYAGGAHAAELVATDIAGNVAKRTWTINVDPEGHISASEATDTLEALEITAPQSTEYGPVAAIVTSGEGEAEMNPKLILEGESFVSQGSPTPTAIGTGASDGFEIENTIMDSSEELQEAGIEILPIAVSAGAGNPTVTEEGSAAIISNSATASDTILRPAYDGLMAFQDIRDAAGPETFSWEVRLGEGEEVKLIDGTHAGVFWDDGTQAMLITAQSAHDADGKAIATSLAVSEKKVVTLTVHHRLPGVTYPVVAGVGYEGGFQTIEGEMLPLTEQAPEGGTEAEGEEAGTAYNGYVISTWAFSAPEPATPAEAEADASAWSLAERASLEHRRFRFIGCHDIEDVLPPYSQSATVEQCGNPFNNNSGPHGVAFNYGIRGSYFRVPGKFSKHTGGQKDHIECAKMLDKSHYGDALVEWKYFVTQTRCEWYGKTSDGEPVYAPFGKHITPYGEWNWGRGYGWDGPFDHFGPIGLALYIWASKDRHIGRHETTCIDCS